MALTSIQRTFRGINCQVDYHSLEAFFEDMNKEESGSREICWAKLFIEETGDMVAEYKRGHSVQR